MSPRRESSDETTPPMAISDRTKVRLSLPQLWTILAAVAGGAAVVAGELQGLKAEMSSYRERTELLLSTTQTAVKEIKDDRADSKREWSAWRYRVDESNTRQDTELINHTQAIRALENRAR